MKRLLVSLTLLCGAVLVVVLLRTGEFSDTKGLVLDLQISDEDAFVVTLRNDSNYARRVAVNRELVQGKFIVESKDGTIGNFIASDFARMLYSGELIYVGTWMIPSYDIGPGDEFVWKVKLKDVEKYMVEGQEMTRQDLAGKSVMLVLERVRVFPRRLIEDSVASYVQVTLHSQKIEMGDFSDTSK